MSQGTLDENISDEELARRAQGGCARSFELLVMRFQVPLLRFLRRRVACDADAEDLLQDTFVRAYQRLERYCDSWRFSTWIFTIAHRQAISRHRSQVARNHTDRSLSHMADLSLSDTSAGPSDALQQAESRAHLWDVAAQTLGPEQFAAIWLYYVEDMDTHDLARVLGRSWVSLKTMLFRARAKLMPVLREHYGDIDPTHKRRSISGRSPISMKRDGLQLAGSTLRRNPRGATC